MDPPRPGARILLLACLVADLNPPTPWMFRALRDGVVVKGGTDFPGPIVTVCWWLWNPNQPGYIEAEWHPDTGQDWVIRGLNRQVSEAGLTRLIELAGGGVFRGPGRRPRYPNKNSYIAAIHALYERCAGQGWIVADFTDVQIGQHLRPRIGKTAMYELARRLGISPSDIKAKRI